LGAKISKNVYYIKHFIENLLYIDDFILLPSNENDDMMIPLMLWSIFNEL